MSRIGEKHLLSLFFTIFSIFMFLISIFLVLCLISLKLSRSQSCIRFCEPRPSKWRFSCILFYISNLSVMRVTYLMFNVIGMFFIKQCLLKLCCVFFSDLVCNDILFYIYSRNLLNFIEYFLEFVNHAD